MKCVLYAYMIKHRHEKSFLNLKVSNIIKLRHLYHIGIGAVIKDAKAYDPDRTRFGFIPFMAKTYLGRLLAESFCEWMISHANIVMSKCNSFL